MDSLEWLTLIIGWETAILVGLFGTVILVQMARGKIDLAKLISEKNGDASMSRFQFLIFTFVIALSLDFLTIKGGGFPEIPAGVYAILGISGGSYVISKGIQVAKEKPPTVSDGGEAPPGAVQ